MGNIGYCVQKITPAPADLDLLNITAWPTLLGSLPIVVVALILPAPPIVWSQTFILTVTYSIFLSGSLAWVLWMYALQRLPAGIASMASMLIPLVAVACAWLQLGERPNQIELAGMCFIALALVIISLITIRKHQQVEVAQGQE